MTGTAAPAQAALAINRRGEIIWATASCTRWLTARGLLTDGRRPRLNRPWTLRLWAEVQGIHANRLSPLAAIELGVAGVVQWSPRRPNRLVIAFWSLEDLGFQIDTLWQAILASTSAGTGASGRLSAAA